MQQQILKLTEVKLITALSASTIYRLVQDDGKFPAPIKLSERSSGWLKSEVEQWIKDRIATSRGEAA